MWCSIVDSYYSWTSRRRSGCRRTEVSTNFELTEPASVDTFLAWFPRCIWPRSVHLRLEDRSWQLNNWRLSLASCSVSGLVFSPVIVGCFSYPELTYGLRRRVWVKFMADPTRDSDFTRCSVGCRMLVFTAFTASFGLAWEIRRGKAIVGQVAPAQA